jgi:Uma2 family endonuclease
MDLPKHKMTADEFLSWDEALPSEAGRYELWDGEVTVVHGPAGFENAERAQHWKVKGALYRALHDAVKRAGVPCHVACDGPSVRFSEHRLVKPDALVYDGPEVPPWMLEVPHPLIVGEVLSPTTRKKDMGDKRHGYFALPSLHHYLVVDPDRPLLIHHQRGSGPKPLPPQIVKGPRLRLDPPGLDVDLTEVLGV